MATTREEGAAPDFLRMDAPVGSDAANIDLTGDWHGWPHKEVKPVTLLDDQGRLVRIRTPVMDLEGLITPTDLHYTVQHFAVPEVVPADQWLLTIEGEVKNPLTLNFDDLRRLPGRSVRTVSQASGTLRRALRQRRHFLRVFPRRGPQAVAHPRVHDPQRQRVDRRALGHRAGRGRAHR